MLVRQVVIYSSSTPNSMLMYALIRHRESILHSCIASPKSQAPSHPPIFIFYGIDARS